MGFENLKIWIKNLRNSDKNKKNESYDKIEDDDEAPIEAKKDDKNPGKVKLNGGSHDNVMGLNRKMVVVIGSVIFTIIAASYIYNIQDEAARKALKEQNSMNTRDKAAVTHNDEIGYEQVFNQSKQGLLGANDRFANRNNSTANNGEDPLARPNRNNNNNSGNNNSDARGNNTPVVATPATVPQIPSYNRPATGAVTTPQQTPTVSEAERIEAENKRNELTKYKSAIAFSLGSGGNGNMAQGGQSSSSADNTDGEKGAKPTNVSQSNFPTASIQFMPASDGVLQAGTVIPAMLFSGINTNVAGQVTAQTMADVYDTATHSNLLIPMGSQLIGSYDSNASSGNNRVNVTFSTIVLPDGSSYAINNSMVAVDSSGYNGIAGKIDHHTDKAIRDGLLNSAFTALSSKWANRVYLDMSTITNITKMDGVRPTITINPGKEFNLFVTKPIIFAQ